MIARLATHIWIAAFLRRVAAAGAFSTIVHRGDADRGDVLIKVLKMRGSADLYGPAFSPDGANEFELLVSGDEPTVDALIGRRRASDHDLWVVEVEDSAGRHFLTESVR
jgi:hypothetical protein